MPDTDNRVRVVAIAEPGPTQLQITAALNAQPDFHLMDLLPTLEKVSHEVRAAQPDMILIDHQVGGQSTLDVLDDLGNQFPDTPITAILPDSDPVHAQQVMLAGARAFLVQPFTQVNLLSTLRRVRDLEMRRRQAHQHQATKKGADSTGPLRVISVYSPRGGVGCSSVASNLAIALREETDQRVLLMEGKLHFGDLGLMLNIRSRNTIADLIPQANALEEGIVREVVAEHASGIHVLLSPVSLEVAQGIRPEALFNVVTGLRRMFDFIVIDAGNHLDENTVTLLDLSDRVLLLATPDLAALNEASRFIQLSRSLDYPAGKVMTVLNRAGVLGGVRARDIEAALHHQLFAQIPDDGPNALRSVNRGVPLVLRYPRSPMGRSIQRMARLLAEVGSGSAPARAAATANGAKGRGRTSPARAG